MATLNRKHNYELFPRTASGRPWPLSRDFIVFMPLLLPEVFQRHERYMAIVESDIDAAGQPGPLRLIGRNTTGSRTVAGNGHAIHAQWKKRVACRHLAGL